MGYSPDRPLLNHLKTHLLLEHLKDVCSETDYDYYEGGAEGGAEQLYI